jgi:glycerate 2-kinase
MEALSSCDPGRAVERSVWAGTERLGLCGRTIGLQKKGRLLVIAYGKAAPRMAEGLRARIEAAGGGRPVRGLVIAPAGGAHAATGGPEPSGGAAASRSGGPPGGSAPPGAGAASGGAALAARRAEWKGAVRITRLTGDHPLPGAASFRAAQSALRLAAAAGPGDDLIFLASGGGSALMAAPLRPFMTPAEKTVLHKLLLVSGAPIATINAVRKHLSAVKGGRLGVAARRAKSQATLVLCDVDPESYEDVASGPSLPDQTTLDDMIRAIDRYGLAPALPSRVLDGLRAGAMPETPRRRDPAFRRARHAMILSNRDLRNAAVRSGLAVGLSAESVPFDLIGPVVDAVERVARAIESAPPGTRLLVLGGEVLTAPSGPGTGGRAQEFALRLALRMAGLGSRPWAFLAFGSDGIDGNSPAAGAFADQTTLDRSRAAGADPAKTLRDSDTHRFFSRLGDAFVTGPTGTNVRDLYLLLTGEPVAPRRLFTPQAP